MLDLLFFYNLKINLIFSLYPESIENSTNQREIESFWKVTIYKLIGSIL